MKKAVKIISLLLSYPGVELQDSAGEMEAAINNVTELEPREKEALVKLANNIATLDLYDAQERYVYLFDRTRTLSLHLFEHVHGESRDRGQAMVDLINMYEQGGFEIDARELPDYLPLFLEYASTRPPGEIVNLLRQTAHIHAALKERLKRRKSIYANAFVALEALAKRKPDAEPLKDLLNEPEDDPDDLEALDRLWEEEAVAFGGNARKEIYEPDCPLIRRGRQFANSRITCGQNFQGRHKQS